jgi:D-serine deaminase-like pyridoxal phosphate-dependent protein
VTQYLGDLDTPVPIVDITRLERNITRMAERVGATGTDLRPHVKAHKTRQVAERQLARGAIGLTVAKLGEAEAMVDAGFEDVFIAYPLVTPPKVRRLLDLIDRARVRFTVDSAAGARVASDVLGPVGVTVEVIIEIETGNGRTGVQSEAEAVELADLVDSLPGLRVAGVLGFGPGYVDGEAAQRELARQESTIAASAAQAIRAAGHDGARIVTVGCTPTSPFSAEHPEVTEVRPGVYVYYDCKQVSLGAATLDDCALTVLATVVSTPAPRRYILDAGMKALAGEDYGWGTHGRLLEHPDVLITRAAEEHGIINLADDVADPKLRVGDRVRIVPNHACGCSNMHDRVVAVDGEQVIETWPVIARGRVQ